MKYIFLLIFTWFLGYSIFFGIFKDENTFIDQNIINSWTKETIQVSPPSNVLENQTHKEKCGENACFVDNTCVKIPVHASCNNEESGIISSKDWSCKTWYREQEGTCMCQSWSYVCKDNQAEVSILDENIKTTEVEIKWFVVNQGDEASVLKYNSLVDMYNRLLTERNTFMNEKCYCEGAYNFSEVFRE